MSLPWLDRLTLFLHPRAVMLERHPWRGQAERFTALQSLADNSDASWQTSLAAATHLLATHASHRSQLSVIVANQFVRYSLLPWSPEILGDKARLAMARAIFVSSQGKQAEQLDIALDQPLFGMNGLATGIHRDLLDGVRRAAKATHLRLSSIQPRLTSDLATNGRTINDGCVAFHDEGWLTLIGLRAGNLCLLRNHRVESAPEQLTGELQGILAMESAEVNAKTLHIFGVGPWPSSLGEWQVEHHDPSFKDSARA